MTLGPCLRRDDGQIVRRDVVPLWQRLLITFAVMLLASYLVGLLWHWLFNSEIPSYLSGLVGGVSAVPTWEFLQRIRPKQ
jgi:hypothetical protein